MKKIINITYSNEGGAGTAVLRINEVLNSFLKSSVLSFKGVKNQNSIVLGNTNLYILRRKLQSNFIHFYYKLISKKYFKKFNYYNYSEKDNYFNSDILIKNFPFTPDILIVHYTSHFVNFKTIYEIQKKTGCKIIFNLLDTSFLTGGCHYSWECRGYELLCQDCPAIKFKKHKINSHENLLQKLKYLKKIDCIVNVSSSYALNQVSRSTLFKNHKRSLILYPIPSYREYKYSFEKSKKKIVFLGIQDISDERKGYKYFLNAVSILKESIEEEDFKNIQFRIAGKNKNKSKNMFKNFQFLGHLNNIKLVKEYCKADLFLCSSIEDNGPMMINEALSFGTPVVCFDVGISRDLVNKKNGFIAENKNPGSLSEGIKFALFKKNYDRKKIIAKSKSLFSYEIIANKWKTLINDTLQ